MTNFAITGVCGAVARRHLDAIARLRGRVVAGLDPHDAAGILDAYDLGIAFFQDRGEFERYLAGRSGPQRIRYLTVCSPNFVHVSDCQLGLRLGADVICEKPVAIHPDDLDVLRAAEIATGHRIWTVLQLRGHERLRAVRERVLAASSRRFDVVLTYVTARGPWYDASWKGRLEASGGIATNIGVHLFDLIVWLFGAARRDEVHLREPRRMAGFIELERANVTWFLSVEPQDLPADARGRTTYRTLMIDGKDVDFSEGVADLHHRIYEETLNGRGFGLQDARQSIEIAERCRTLCVDGRGERHPFLRSLSRA